MLLAAISMAVPVFADTTVADDATVSTTSLNDVTVSDTPTTSPDLTSASDKQTRLQQAKAFAAKQLEQKRTLVRCAALFAAKNLTSRYVGKKLPGAFDASVYAMWVIKAALNSALPSTNEATKAKVAEFLASEISVLKKDKTGLNDFTDINRENVRKGALRMLYKAGSRKQFFLPKDSEAAIFLRENPLGMITMPFIESLPQGTVLPTAPASSTAKLAYASAVRPLLYASAGLFAGKLAKPAADQVDGYAKMAALHAKCPEVLSNFLLSENGSDLIKNLIAQALEDGMNTHIDWQIKNN